MQGYLSFADASKPEKGSTTMRLLFEKNQPELTDNAVSSNEVGVFKKWDVPNWLHSFFKIVNL